MLSNLEKIMRAKIDVLRQHVSQLKAHAGTSSVYRVETYRNQDKLATYAQIGRLLDYLAPENIFLGNNYGYYPKKSGLLFQEECDAIAFFVAFMERYYSSSNSPIILMPALSTFIKKLKTSYESHERNTSVKLPEFYCEMVHWGLVILNQYQQALESQKIPIISPVTQEILKKVAAPQIFVNLSAYKKALSDEKAQRYREYIEARKKYRAQLPLLQARLQIYQLQRSLGTVISLIPGVFFLKEGLPEIWGELKKGGIWGALTSFIAHAVFSAFSPLGALFNYIGYGVLLENVEKDIAEADASKDYVVTRVLNASEYNSLKEFRKSFKRQHQEAVTDDLTKTLNKPKKHIERFTDGQTEKVRLYLDKQQVERLEAYQAFRYGRRIDATTFFKGIKSSQRESMATVEMLHNNYEKRVARPL